VGVRSRVMVEREALKYKENRLYCFERDPGPSARVNDGTRAAKVLEPLVVIIYTWTRRNIKYEHRLILASPTHALPKSIPDLAPRCIETLQI